MERKILVYGHGDKSKEGFASEEDIKAYIGGDIFLHNHGRYRYSQNKDANIIILTRDGYAYGHFVIYSINEPTEKDKAEYSRVKRVYLVKESFVYEEAVRIKNLGITGYQFGRYISEEKFSEIINSAGGYRKVFC